MLPGMYSHRLRGAGVAPGGGLVDVITGHYEENTTYPEIASVAVTYDTSGIVEGYTTGPGGTWKLTAAPSSNYDIRFDVNGVTGTWQNLGTSRSYVLSRTAPSGSGSPTTSTVVISIRLAATLVVLDSGTSTFSVYVEPGGP